MAASSETKQPLSVLFVTSEIYPLIKTGGLADVSASLPEALQQQGVDVRLLLPGYPQVLDGLKTKWVSTTGVFEFGEVRLLTAVMPDSGVPVIVVDYPPFFQRDGGPYQDRFGQDWSDNALRFGLLSRVGAILGSSGSPLAWRPDIVHCNDWQSGLTPAYLHFMQGRKAATLMTIHNLAYQGIFPPQLAAQLGLPPESFSMHGVEYCGNLSFMKAGLFYADHIATVSPTYAEEIQTDALGFGMQGLLAERGKHLTGIINGIDTAHWNPATDVHLAAKYNAKKLAAKAANKSALQARLGLAPEPDTPLFAVISRITHQKGLDLLLDIAPALLREGVQIALLGSGDATLEHAFRNLARLHPGQVSATIGFDEGLSHLMEAGADIFLMPSRFEPCGLNQMYSQCYGTPPVVHATGGLADTVVDATPATLKDGSASGFVFRRSKAPDFLVAVKRALAVYRDKKAWRTLQKNGMGRDFSWERSAQQYIELYRSLQA
jgi:starch synthase